MRNAISAGCNPDTIGRRSTVFGDENQTRISRPETVAHARTRSRFLALALLASLFATGCANDQAAREQLNSGYRALDAKNYDQALTASQAYLTKTPSGPGSAEALYLQGRVYEEKAQQLASDPVSARAKLDAAADAYRRGLQMPAVPSVQALLHAGLANVAYHYDDYGTAVREWQVSYAGLESNDAKAWVLYRIGLCQQRLGWFPQADRSFTMVRQQFPGSEPAQRAATHIGAKAFYVQVGAFADLANASRVVTTLRKQSIPSEIVAEQGREVVRVGPAASYADARTLQLRLASQFPAAVVVP